MNGYIISIIRLDQGQHQVTTAGNAAANAFQLGQRFVIPALLVILLRILHLQQIGPGALQARLAQCPSGDISKSLDTKMLIGTIRSKTKVKDAGQAMAYPAEHVTPLSISNFNIRSLLKISLSDFIFAIRFCNCFSLWFTWTAHEPSPSVCPLSLPAGALPHFRRIIQNHHAVGPGMCNGHRGNM